MGETSHLVPKRQSPKLETKLEYVSSLNVCNPKWPLETHVDEPVESAAPTARKTRDPNGRGLSSQAGRSPEAVKESGSRGWAHGEGLIQNSIN